MRRVGAAVTLAVTAGVFAAVSMAASPPTVTTGPASGVTNTAATVKGTVDPNGGTTTTSVQYGTTRAYGQQTTTAGVGAGTTPVAVTASLNHLTRGTTYHYRLIATNPSGTRVGRDATFRTTGTAPKRVTAPRVKTLAATTVRATRATVHGTVEPRGHAVKVYFEFGRTKFYGVQTVAKPVAAAHSSVSVRATLTHLQSGQTYHYRVVALDVSGHTAVGADMTVRLRHG